MVYAFLSLQDESAMHAVVTDARLMHARVGFMERR